VQYIVTTFIYLKFKKKIMIFVIMKELLRCFIVVSSAHLHLQAPCFDVLAL